MSENDEQLRVPGRIPAERDHLSVVIPVHNRVIKTMRCLRSLLMATAKTFEIGIVVVDDGSTDGTAALIKHRFPGVEIIRGNGELFWTGAVNQGIRRALETGATWIVVLNNDTVHEAEFLEHMVKCARKNPGAVIGAKILYLSRPETIRFAGGTWKFRKYGWFYPHEGRPSETTGRAPFAVESINGNCCLFARQLLDRHGIYDEKKYPHYYADSAFTVRLRKAGVRLLIEPKAIIWDDDTDIRGRLRMPNGSVRNIFKETFCAKKSPNNWRALFWFYWETSPIGIDGLLLWMYRFLRRSAKIVLVVIARRCRQVNRGRVRPV